MNIGDLDRRIVIEQPSLSPDGGGGGGAATWTTFATVWGRLQAMGGGEAVQGQRPHGVTRHRVVIRRRADITAAMRVTCDGRVFNIRAVVNGGGRDPYTLLECEEGPAT
jgi:SPP1 family predicted phage head-tail adaptor